MKKTHIFFVLLCVLLCLSTVFCGCVKEDVPKEFTVTFNGDGGTLVEGEEIQTVLKASELVPPIYEKEGFEFSGWDKNLSKITSDTTVKAVWVKDVYTVYFDLTGIKSDWVYRNGSHDLTYSPVTVKVEGQTSFGPITVKTGEAMGDNLPKASDVSFVGVNSQDYMFGYWYYEYQGERKKVESTTVFNDANILTGKTVTLKPLIMTVWTPSL